MMDCVFKLHILYTCSMQLSLVCTGTFNTNALYFKMHSKTSISVFLIISSDTKFFFFIQGNYNERTVVIQKKEESLQGDSSVMDVTFRLILAEAPWEILEPIKAKYFCQQTLTVPTVFNFHSIFRGPKSLRGPWSHSYSPLSSLSMHIGKFIKSYWCISELICITLNLISSPKKFFYIL